MFHIRILKRQAAGVFTAILFLVGCAVVEPPSMTELDQVGGGGKTIVLMRIVGQDNEGHAVDTFSGSLSDDNVGLAIGNFETGGLPTQRLDWIRFLSEESRQNGWIYLVLTPGVHYMAVQGSRRTNAFTYAARFKTAPRWRLDIPADAAVVYAGTLDLRGTSMALLFGGRLMVTIEGDNSTVRDESVLAADVIGRNLADLGSPKTALMTYHTGPLILTTPPSESD